MYIDWVGYRTVQTSADICGPTKLAWSLQDTGYCVTDVLPQLRADFFLKKEYRSLTSGFNLLLADVEETACLLL